MCEDLFTGAGVAVLDGGIVAFPDTTHGLSVTA